MITTLVLSLLLVLRSEAPKVGPASGALIVDGGGENAESIKTVRRAGGGAGFADRA